MHTALPTKSLTVFSHFLHSCCLRPDGFLAVGALSSCGRTNNLIAGKVIHGIILRNQLDLNPIVGNDLIDMYYQNGQIEVAVTVFERMGIKDISSRTSLFKGFILCNNLHSACQMFDAMPERNSISWTAMITGYVRGGAPIQALNLFKQMKLTGEAHPTAITIVAVLSGCADTGALHFGHYIHGHVNKTNLKHDDTVDNALLDMYLKNGRIDFGARIFNEMLQKYVFSWTTMISGYAYHGEGNHALHVYNNMIKSGFSPNEVALLSVLTASSHSGLVSERKLLFKRMTECHRLKPKIEHYGCLVDLLGRTELLEEAKRVIEKMPMKPDAAI